MLLNLQFDSAVLPIASPAQTSRDSIMLLCSLQGSLSCTAFFFLLPQCLVARDIAFPPVAPLQANLNPHHTTHSNQDPGHDQTYQTALGADKDQLLELNKFAGLTTFSNLPWVHCLSSDNEVEKYDIAFLGAPFDTGTTGRPGARFGPSGIRL